MRESGGDRTAAERRRYGVRLDRAMEAAPRRTDAIAGGLGERGVGSGSECDLRAGEWTS